MKSTGCGNYFKVREWANVSRGSRFPLKAKKNSSDLAHSFLGGAKFHKQKYIE